MALSSAQYVILKADIEADPVLNAFPNNSDGAFAIAQAYNLQASPDWTVWKSRVTISEIGDAFDGGELANRTTADTNRLAAMEQHSKNGIEPSRPDRRAFYDDIFSASGGSLTRAALLVLYRRLSTRVEQLFSVGTGSTVLPATMSFEGNLSYQDVQVARNS